MSARTSRPSRLRRTSVAVGIVAAALTAGTVAPAMAVPGPPAGDVFNAPTGRTADSDLYFDGSATPGDVVDIEINGTVHSVPADGGGNWEWDDQGVADGHYTYNVTIGGQPIGASTGAFVIDTTEPVVTFGTTPGAVSTSSDVTFTWSAADDDADLTYYWALDDEDEHDGTDVSASYTGLENGTHWFQVWAEDSVGNYTDPVEVEFEVAVPGPAIAWASTPAASTTSTTAHFAVTVPAGALVEYVLDLPENAQSADPISVSGSDFTVDGLSVGHHKIQVGATLNGLYSEILVFEWDVTGAAAPAPVVKAPVLASTAIPTAVVARGIKQGASGPSVSLIQSIVGTPADGRFGAKTTAAVKAFQRAHGLYADGIVGPLTWAAIVDVANGGSGMAPVTAKSVPAAQIARGIKAGSAGQAVSVVQHALGAPVTGKFDAKTTAAVKAFQASHGLKVDGIVGPKTWAALVAKH